MILIPMCAYAATCFQRKCKKFYRTEFVTIKMCVIVWDLVRIRFGFHRFDKKLPCELWICETLVQKCFLSFNCVTASVHVILSCKIAVFWEVFFYKKIAGTYLLDLFRGKVINQTAVSENKKFINIELDFLRLSW